MTTDATRQIIGQWVYKYTLNFKQPPQGAIEAFAKSLLIAAKGDSVISQAERDWVVGLTAAKGASEELIEKLKNYAADEDIEQVLSKDSIADGAREALLYTAIEASAADGEYNDGEKASVRKIAAKLGVSEDVVKQLEAHYEEEKALFKKKIKTLYPNGHASLYDDNGN
ncbi:MAG: TerB family tellurite resistance protein [Brasilonema angustatum HA4187-MV1]|jgi:tellurite resistance protein|nr:TerB family tellurite resistance protein [Brasilonema angustatum HA4187-MV1]